MTDDKVEFRDDFDVNLQDWMGNDARIASAARVSVQGADAVPAYPSAFDEDSSPKDVGLINFLMKNRHGTPFEHNAMTFFVSAPIFVFREFQRHRIGFSYNETSGRYSELKPVFYTPAEDRPLVQTGKAGAYSFVPGTYDQTASLGEVLRVAYCDAWTDYQRLLDKGIAKEVSRVVLPVGIYSSMYVTCNVRSLMSFLSLRTKYLHSTFPSYPQWEIEQVANQMEAAAAERFPIAFKAFQDNGRVAP